MTAKLNKIAAQIDKELKKRAQTDLKIKELEAAYRSEESTVIYDMVKAADLTPDKLKALIDLAAHSVPDKESFKSLTGSPMSDESGEVSANEY